MWNLKLPSKIRIGMWKITNEFMPTLHNLRKKRLVVDDLCPMCKVEKESVAHLVWDCAFTRMVLSWPMFQHMLWQRKVRVMPNLYTGWKRPRKLWKSLSIGIWMMLKMNDLGVEDCDRR